MVLPQDQQKTEDESDRGQENFLTRPVQPRVLEFGELKTDVDENKAIKPAVPKRLETLASLQRLNTPVWKEVRFSKALRYFQAYPGFTDLKINEELCHLDKRRDSVAPTERVLASLANAVLEQKELLQEGLQEVVNWTSNNPTELNPDTLFHRLASTFGPESKMASNFTQILQIICGKRAECVEIRRERLLAEVQNKNVQAAMRKIPPSVDYLFGKDSLNPLIQSLGGPQNWLGTPSYATKRPTFKREFQRGTGRGTLSGNTTRPSPVSRNQSFKPRGDTKKIQPRPRSNDSFRKPEDK
ncbi:uncharacterized protein [Fopius arisanus]|uniref:Uncharacterized protein n=1 Tax=Fopius arisanus TaxID=64838 RepID=A0A9R1UAF8_9HYME|nr:PREDICTED: uncharacterized protein LOC105272655 [Fopius arisanus]